MVRNVEVRWGEHNNPTKKSNPSKHIKDNVDHMFHWLVLARAPTNTSQRKVLEAYIVLEKLPLMINLSLTDYIYLEMV